MDRVVVVGAGLTGLAAAHRLGSRASAARRPIEVVVLEAKDRIGGVDLDRPGRRGFTLEGGADSFITNKPWALDLCRELGLGDQLIGTDDRNRRSFVVRKGEAPAGARGVRPDGPRPAAPAPGLAHPLSPAASSGC